MTGKIIKQGNSIGVIEYDLDKRITFSVKSESKFEIGDEVDFDINKKTVPGTDTSYPFAIDLKIIKAKKSLENTFTRLIKYARKYNTTIQKLADILKSNGFEVRVSPTTKIGEEESLIIENYFEKSETAIKEKSNSIERGTIILTNVIDVVEPSIILVDFFNNKKAILPLNNISWNKSRSQKIIKNTKKGDEIKVVYLGEDSNQNHLVSIKHLNPRPNETNYWNSLNSGKIVEGRVFEILINTVIIELSNNIFGVVHIGESFKKSIGEKSFYEVSNNNNTLYVELKVSHKSKKSEEDGKTSLSPRPKRKLKSNIESSYLAFETDLQSLKAFEDSIYYNFCDSKEKEFLESAFTNNPTLFANSISLKQSLNIQFGLNLPAWESDFKNKLIPYLKSIKNQEITEEHALEHLSKEKYWLRINHYNKDGEDQTRWVIFNEDYFLSGFVDDDNSNFVVLSLAIKRTRKDKSNQKSRNLSDGTFLYDAELTFSSPFQNKLKREEQQEIFNLLNDKTEAFELIRRLKEESGALLLEEGLSLQIFDRFLEYQENLLKKGNTNNRIWIDSDTKSVTSDLGELSIEISTDLSELCDGNSLSARVTIRTLEDSTKISRNEEFVFFSDATLEVLPNGSRLHFAHSDLLLDELKNGFYVEPKISLKQIRVQREVLQDFFSKKIKLQHIESLLLRPDKIIPPKTPDLDFFNEILRETDLLGSKNNQIKAVKKSVGNRNIFLVQGPPGTGKTTVIAEIVQQLTNQGEKILVTSQTHIAVDNVLEKLAKNKSISLLRLGNIQRVNPKLIQFHKEKQIEIFSGYFTQVLKVNKCLAEKFIKSDCSISKKDLLELANAMSDFPQEIHEEISRYSIEFIDSLISLDKDKINNIPVVLGNWSNHISNEEETLIKPLIYNSVDVVFATCIGVKTDSDLVDFNVGFDTVIIDEAGKANLSESIAAISMAKKVILVGDQMQLPPYIDGSLLDSNEKSSFPNSRFGSKFLEQDVQHALRTSFFEYLVKKIEHQTFPKDNIEMLNYQHRMHPDIGEFISDAFYDGKVKMGEKTVENVLNLPAPFDKQLIFIDTSSADNPYEIKDGVSVRNDIEAQCISQLVLPAFLNNGINKSEFAIVAPYKSQVKNLKHHISATHPSHCDHIDISTLDSFQGKEFDVIVFSFTRSARNSKVGFLDDARRLNVAFSRAKKKLILIGNSETLTDYRSHYDQLFDYTGLFRRLIQISKNPKIGNFVNITDFTDLKSRFQSQIEKIKIGDRCTCQLKLTFEKSNYHGHIFYIKGTSLEGMFRDGNMEFEYIQDNEYEMYVSNIDFTNEKVYISPKRPIKSVFFEQNKVGDPIYVSYKTSIDYGHFFEIEFGFDCFMIDPRKQHEFEKHKTYKVFISLLNKKEEKVQVTINKNKKPEFRKARNLKQQKLNVQAKKLKFFNSHKVGDPVIGKYKSSTSFGHFFEMEEGFDGLVFDAKSKYENLVKGKPYNLKIVGLDTNKGRVNLDLIKK